MRAGIFAWSAQCYIPGSRREFRKTQRNSIFVPWTHEWLVSSWTEMHFLTQMYLPHKYPTPCLWCPRCTDLILYLTVATTEPPNYLVLILGGTTVSDWCLLFSCHTAFQCEESVTLALCPVIATLLSLLYFSNLVAFVVVGQEEWLSFPALGLRPSQAGADHVGSFLLSQGSVLGLVWLESPFTLVHRTFCLCSSFVSKWKAELESCRVGKLLNTHTHTHTHTKPDLQIRGEWEGLKLREHFKVTGKEGPWWWW